MVVTTALYLILGLSAVQSTSGQQVVVFEDFESGYQKWHLNGEAFGVRPARGTLPAQSEVSGFRAQCLANSFVNGDSATGTITSEEFALDQPYITFLVGGGDDELKVSFRLIVDGQLAASATGKNQEKLDIRTWNVSNWKGRKAHFEIVDDSTKAWGHILVDQIEFRDAVPKDTHVDVHRYLVVPVYFDDTAHIRPHPRDYYQALMGDRWPGLNWYFKTASGGRANVDGSVVWDWTRLPGKAERYAQSSGQEANKKRGWDCKKLLDGLLANYPDRVRLTDWYGVAFCPNVLDELGGGAATWIDYSVGGKREMYPVLFLNHTQGQSVWVHELSHHFQVTHIDKCSDGVQENPFSVMSFWGFNHNVYGGIAEGHNAYHKMKIGWVPQERIIRLLPTRDEVQVNLSRLAGAPNDGQPQIVLIPEEKDWSVYYTVEARRFAGEDLEGALPMEGVVIHRVTPSNRDRESSLQKHDAIQGEHRSGVWLPGEVFKTPNGRIKVSVVGQTAAGYVVKCSTGR
jgi:hypothetical protein